MGIKCFPPVLAMLIVVQAAPCAAAAAALQVELATERGVQITAPQEWLQLFTRLGIEHVQIRSKRPGDKPRVENRGSERRPRYHVLAILTSRGELYLPGAKLGRSDRAKLRDYFERLAADGPEAVTSPPDRFGLPPSQLAAVVEDLTRVVGFSTKEKRPRDLLEQFRKLLSYKITLSPTAEARLARAEPCQTELRGFTAGTSLALLCRDCGLAMTPTKALGMPVVLKIDELSESESWPVGWDAEVPPRKLAPKLLEFLNVQISGYTLSETLAAIEPKIGIPLWIDQAALSKHGIVPDAVQISIPKTRTFYKRIIDRSVAQARLYGELRIDEAGTPFYWITKK